jgi:hypothetical protein
MVDGDIKMLFGKVKGFTPDFSAGVEAMLLKGSI